MQVSAYIPSFNNADTLRQAIDSIRRQSVCVSELFVVDDCSADGSVEIAEQMSVPVNRLSKNTGRGAVRAIAMKEAKYPLVLSLDGSKTLPPNFLADALTWFNDNSVAAVFGRVIEPASAKLAQRWSRRHLLKQHLSQPVCRTGSLITAGALVSKQAVLQVGNFDSALSYAEDRELGARLIESGFDVIFDPVLEVNSLYAGGVLEVLERYWRWHAPLSGRISWSAYLKQILYSIKVMSVEDMQAGDPLSVLVSLLSPHYQALCSLTRQSSSPRGRRR